MPHENRFCPTFLALFENIISLFPKSKEDIKKDILIALKNRLGDSIPRFPGYTLKKQRIGLKAYNEGKSKGLRFIFLFLEEKTSLIPIHLYKKGYKQEHKIVKKIRTNLKKILDELKNKECSNLFS